MDKEQKLKEIKEKLESNALLWGMYYCPLHFSSASPWFHTEILAECKKTRFLAVAAPRESSKSTLLAFLKPAHLIAHKKKHFIVIVQNTYAKSCSSLATIKDEFRNNPKLKAHYGILFEKDSEGDTIFVHPDGFKTRVLCKGHEQIGSVRGEKFGPNRPDLILGDDLEDDVMVRSRDRRQNLNDEFDDALIPAGDRATCDYIFIGTILHDDSLMAKLVSDEHYPEYEKLFYKALNKVKNEEISLWPEKWTVEDLKKIQREKPSVFAKEYQNNPVSGAMAKFHREDFRYWAIENLEYVLYDDEGRICARGSLLNCKAAIACDLAWEEKRQHDYSVIVPAFLTPQSDILVDSYICKKGMRPHEIEEVLFSMDERLRSLTKSSVFIGFEKAKLEKVMQYLLKQAMRKRNKYLIFKPLLWDSDQIQRIETRLEPRYAQHVIYHRRGMGELEHQLLRFPTGMHNDLPDAIQGLIQLLQYPKSAKKAETENSEFDWWRQAAIDARKPKKERFVFGGTARTRLGIPAKMAYR